MNKESEINTKAHAYIIASPSVEKREKRALKIACSHVCKNQEQAPCFECSACRNTLAGLHPDVIEISRKIDDKGKVKREIQVEQIRKMAADAYTRPQQAEKKVYIIKDAASMNITAQNAALKILEEPPAYVVIILCADSAEALLATIRSRCIIIREDGEKEGSENELALEYVSLAAKKDSAKLCSFFGRNESIDTEQMNTLINDVKFCLKNVICLEKSYAGLTRNDAVRLLSLCDRAEEYLRLNVGVKHILGMLCVLTI